MLKTGEFFDFRSFKYPSVKKGVIFTRVIIQYDYRVDFTDYYCISMMWEDCKITQFINVSEL